ncbi:hypothetical protein DFH27DRAFT_522434 [Peziza echinospora]|nr:hypothetical protein DFH27DRAFT_522434 [Peziza echinospora]
MYYILYLASLCKRRRWPEPHYDSYPYNGGYACNVRVNQRDYASDDIHATQDLAREAAAQRAYLICYNISISEGVYPEKTPGSGIATQQPIASQQSALQSGQVPISMAQPRYVPPTGNILAGANGLGNHNQGQLSNNGRMVSSQGLPIASHLNPMGL